MDAEPARAHVTMLRASGLGLKRIAALAGVGHGALSKLVYGDSARGMAPSSRIRPATERRILAVQPSLDVLGARRPVDGTGTRRRLQALVALGWSMTEVGRRLGWSPANACSLIGGNGPVGAGTARAARALYDELWSARPPGRTDGCRRWDGTTRRSTTRPPSLTRATATSSTTS